MKSLSMSKRGWVAALGGVLLTASVTVAAGATSAAAGNLSLTNALVNRVAGSTTNVTLVNVGVGGNVFPAAAGATIDILFSSVTKADGTAVVAGDGVLATWCGNVDATTNVALTGSDIGGLAGIAAYCTPIPTGGLTATTTAGDVEVTGTLTGLPAASACRTSAQNVAAGGGPTIIPCVLVVANLAQEVALSMPLVNVTTAQVAGPLDVATGYTSVIGACTSVAPAPSKGCPSTRPTTSLPPPAGTGFHPVAFGGIGFAPTSNNLSSAAYTADLTAFGTCMFLNGNDVTLCGTELAAVSAHAGESAGGVAPGGAKLCSDKAGTSCVAGDGISPLNPAGYGSGSATGQLSGAFTVKAATAPGSYYLHVTYARTTATGNPASPTTTVTQTQVAPFTVLAAPSCNATVPASGGVGATTSITCSGLEPYTAGTVEVLDTNGYVMSTAAVTSTGSGTATASGLAAQYPAANVKATFAAGAENGAAFTATKAFDSTQVNACADPASCAAALITTATVLPGNIALFTDDPSFALNDVDLSTIDLSDNTTWYPLGDPATSPIVLIGDFTGSNAGFAITGTATAMQGAAVKANTIPAYDIWYGNINCAVEGDISGNASTPGNEPLGVILAGADSAPDMDSDAAPSPLADGSADICSVAADANGREGGVFELQFDVQAAGRVNTAADDYSGLIILTVTSAP